MSPHFADSYPSLYVFASYHYLKTIASTINYDDIARQFKNIFFHEPFFLALEFYCISFFITFAAENDENNQYYESV